MTTRTPIYFQPTHSIRRLNDYDGAGPGFRGYLGNRRAPFSILLARSTPRKCFDENMLHRLLEVIADGDCGDFHVRFARHGSAYIRRERIVHGNSKRGGDSISDPDGVDHFL